MEFNVTLDRYEGPYTKLLELIEGKKLSITEISLVLIADEYIAYIKTLDNKNVIDISQFIVVASTLMLMKAKSLLPEVVYTNEEEKQVHDLEYKLELYALLTNASSHVRSLFGKKPLYTRPYVPVLNLVVFVPDSRVTQELLQSVASLTLLSFVTPKVLVKVAVEQALRIENVIESLLKRVSSAKTISPQSIASGATSFEEQKKTLIVNFLALLELLRTGSLVARQVSDGGDIEITHKGGVGDIEEQRNIPNSQQVPSIEENSHKEEVITNLTESSSLASSTQNEARSPLKPANSETKTVTTN